MPQLDLGIYFFQIFLNCFFFWFLYFFIKFIILGKLSNIIKVKTFFLYNNDFTYNDNIIFYNKFELSYYKNINWKNFHNFTFFFNIFKIKNIKLELFLLITNIKLFINKIINNSYKNILKKNIKILLLN